MRTLSRRMMEEPVPELILKLTIDPVTGKQMLSADYRSDRDALPSEHEEEHRQLLGKLLHGDAPGEGSAVVMDRETPGVGGSAERPGEGERQGQGERDPIAHGDG